MSIFNILAGGTMEAATNVLMPALQAAATILVLKQQQKQYEEIANERIDLMEEAVDNYVASVDACIASGIFREAFGEIPNAILFEPVDLDEEFQGAANANLKLLPNARRQMTAVNRLVENNDIARLVALDPCALSNLQVQSCQIKDLLAGKLPVDDVIEVMTDTAEQACFHGRVGNVKANITRNIGISRLRAQAAGRNANERHLSQLNRDVSPLARQTHLVDLLQTPTQRLGLALTQAQLIQQSLQNAANADAAGDPTRYAELQAKLQKVNNVLGVEAQRGNMINQFVPNYAALLQPAIQSLTEALPWGAEDATKRPDRETPSNKQGTVVDRPTASTTNPLSTGKSLSGGQ